MFSYKKNIDAKPLHIDSLINQLLWVSIDNKLLWKSTFFCAWLEICVKVVIDRMNSVQFTVNFTVKNFSSSDQSMMANGAFGSEMSTCANTKFIFWTNKTQEEVCWWLMGCWPANHSLNDGSLPNSVQFMTTFRMKWESLAAKRMSKPKSITV